MNNPIFYIILILPVAGYILERYLEHLNDKMWSDKLPALLKGICKEDEYRKSQLYDKENKKLAFWSSTFNLVVILAMIIFGGFSLVDDISRTFSMNLIVVALIFFAIIGFVSEIINIPFSLYDTFVIEKRFGFNRMTMRTFITDHIKSWFISIDSGVCPCSISPLFLYAQPSPPSICSPTNRYSTRSL